MCYVHVLKPPRIKIAELANCTKDTVNFWAVGQRNKGVSLDILNKLAFYEEGHIVSYELERMTCRMS